MLRMSKPKQAPSEDLSEQVNSGELHEGYFSYILFQSPLEQVRGLREKGGQAQVKQQLSSHQNLSVRLTLLVLNPVARH